MSIRKGWGERVNQQCQLFRIFTITSTPLTSWENPNLHFNNLGKLYQKWNRISRRSIGKSPYRILFYDDIRNLQFDFRERLVEISFPKDHKLRVVDSQRHVDV